MQTTYHLIAYTPQWMKDCSFFFFSFYPNQVRVGCCQVAQEASLDAKPFAYVGCTSHLPQVKAYFSTMVHIEVHLSLLWFVTNSLQMEKTERRLMNAHKYFPAYVLLTTFAFLCVCH